MDRFNNIIRVVLIAAVALICAGHVYAAGPDPDAGTDAAAVRKALARKAVALGLDRDPAVLVELERQKEYTLAKTLVERKSAELVGSVTATEEEIAEFAGRMCYTVTYLKNEFGGEREAREFVERVNRGGPARWESEMTVVGCEGVGPRLLDTLFKIEEGGVAVFGKGNRHYVVKLVTRDRTTKIDRLPSWELIEEYLLEKKRAEALGAWVEKVASESEGAAE